MHICEVHKGTGHKLGVGVPSPSLRRALWFCTREGNLLLGFDAELASRLVYRVVPSAAVPCTRWLRGLRAVLVLLRHGDRTGGLGNIIFSTSWLSVLVGF